MFGLVNIEGDILKKIYPFNKIKKVATNKNNFKSFLIQNINTYNFDIKCF